MSARHTATPFARHQRAQQTRWKASTLELPDAARAPGQWREARSVSFILPIEFACYNVWSSIRDEVAQYFEKNEVVWHDGDDLSYGTRTEPGPSPHLLDSQVAALNFWWGLSRTPETLASVLRTLYPDLASLIPPTDSPHLVVPEWIGEANYLGERVGADRLRKRGRYATSADFLMAFLDTAGTKHLVLLESKYTESYEHEEWRHGKERTYGEAFLRGSLLREGAGVSIEDLLIEPFYQLLRQQLLAAEMQTASERDAQSVSVLHVSPKANDSFHTTITSPALVSHGDSVTSSWLDLLKDPTRFKPWTYEEAFGSVVHCFAEVSPGEQALLEKWLRYQRERYDWLGESS